MVLHLHNLNANLYLKLLFESDMHLIFKTAKLLINFEIKASSITDKGKEVSFSDAKYLNEKIKNRYRPPHFTDIE